MTSPPETATLPSGRINDPALRRLALMHEMRAFEEACYKGFASREIHGELHLGIGQEAIAAGLAEHFRPEDALVSTHRNHLHALAKGVSPYRLMAEIFERETGLCRGRGGHMHPFDPALNFSATGIVGSSLPMALGYAYGFAMDAPGRIAVGVLGDGAANFGAVAEAMNMAAAWRLPLLTLVENNGYAISVRAADVTAPPGLLARAASYGIAGFSGDGTDVSEVARVLGIAVAHIRAGNGPALVELSCQRFRGHYEGDADTYRDRAERQRIKAECDPIARTRAQMLAAGSPPELLDRVAGEANAFMTAVLASVRAAPMPPAGDARAFVFAGAA